MKELTATSYAILAHLAAKPWSAYELAGQMTRGLRLIWPRAASAIYEEPKNLVAHGLAKCTIERSGRRKKNVYSITPKGRRAFVAWLAIRSTPPQFESEALVRIFFGEHGDKEPFLETIRGFGEFGAETRQHLINQISGYLRDRGPFSERWHVIAVGARFLLEQAAAMERWADWARREVTGWDTVDHSAAPHGESLLKDLVATFGLSRPQERTGRGRRAR